MGESKKEEWQRKSVDLDVEEEEVSNDQTKKKIDEIGKELSNNNPE